MLVFTHIIFAFKTTEIYPHLIKEAFRKIASPLDYSELWFEAQTKLRGEKNLTQIENIRLFCGCFHYEKTTIRQRLIMLKGNKNKPFSTI